MQKDCGYEKNFVGVSNHQDRQQLNFMELKESDRTTMIEDALERTISLESKHTVECVLAQVRQLSPIEKLLLYLKLPNGRSSTDPLRQPMNPLGSRLEIHHTITWIKTHLHEDPEVSLPKQDVYEQYLDYCQVNGVKALSTADFGKVMKQVYPNVRPRRLGTRGHSRYCYAGLRKRIRLAPPLLPDLGPAEKCALEDGGGGKSGSPEHTLLAAVSVLIREWAGKTLGLKFSSLQELASHLVQSMAVNSQSTAALTVLSAVALPAPRSISQGRPASSSASLGSDGRPPSECSAAASRPASETPRPIMERDHKRKSQDDVERLQLKTFDKVRGKRSKHRSSSSPLEPNASSSQHSLLSKPFSAPSASNCDGTMNSQTFSGVPYSNVKDPPGDMPNNNSLNSNGSRMNTTLMPLPSGFDDTAVSLSESLDVVCDGNAKLNTDSNASSHTNRVDGGPDGKLPIPRLPKPNSKQSVRNFVVFPSPVPQRHQQLQHSSGTSLKQKYKLIKPKPYTNMEKSLRDGEAPTVCAKQPHKNMDSSALSCKDTIKTGDDAIIGCLEKDALDDYLHGGNNSQEQEEELLQYFPQQTQLENQPMQVDSSTSFDKISQLRLLLERNMNQEASGKPLSYQNGLSAAASLSLLSQRSQQKKNLALPLTSLNQQNLSRRVSFEVPVEPDSATSSVPPSPNTKQRFSFLPISPRPYSPTKSSSANVSPFVSPRSTPVSRLKVNGPTGTSYLPLVSSQSGLPQIGCKPSGNIGVSRTMVRSMSVNGEVSPMSPFQTVIPRSSAISKKYTQDNSPLCVDIKPDINSLQEGNNCGISHGNLFLSGNFAHSIQNASNTLPPLHIERPQFPFSMSAPQSPVVHNSKSKKICYNLRKESRALSLEMDSINYSHVQVGLKAPVLQPSIPFSDNVAAQNASSCADRYSQEISAFFPEDEMMPSLVPTSLTSFRSQSVPLRRMVNSATISPMPATALPSPHYPRAQNNIFTFNQFTPLNGNSVPPTPVPSEVNDFGMESEIVHASPATNNPTDYDMRDGDANCCMSQGDGLGAEALNPDLLNEMFRMLEEGKSDAPQTNQGFTQSYTDVTSSFKTDPDETLRGDPLFTAFRLQAVDSEGGSCTEDQLSLNGGSSVAASAADPILSELNSMAHTAASQQEMNILLEEAPSSFMTEDLECEISQLAREVSASQQ